MANVCIQSVFWSSPLLPNKLNNNLTLLMSFIFATLHMYCDKALFWLYSGHVLRSGLVAVNGMLSLCELTLWWLGCSPPSWRTLAPDCPNLSNTPPPYHWKQSTVIISVGKQTSGGRYLSKNMEKLPLFPNDHLGVIGKNKDLFKSKRKLEAFGNLQKWVRWFFYEFKPLIYQINKSKTPSILLFLSQVVVYLVLFLSLVVAA